MSEEMLKQKDDVEKIEYDIFIEDMKEKWDRGVFWEATIKGDGNSPNFRDEYVLKKKDMSKPEKSEESDDNNPQVLQYIGDSCFTLTDGSVIRLGIQDRIWYNLSPNKLKSEEKMKISKECPDCNTANPQEANYCNNCGKNLNNEIQKVSEIDKVVQQAKEMKENEANRLKKLQRELYRKYKPMLEEIDSHFVSFKFRLLKYFICYSEGFGKIKVYRSGDYYTDHLDAMEFLLTKKGEKRIIKAFKKEMGIK